MQEHSAEDEGGKSDGGWSATAKLLYCTMKGVNLTLHPSRALFHRSMERCDLSFTSKKLMPREDSELPEGKLCSFLCFTRLLRPDVWGFPHQAILQLLLDARWVSRN